MVMGEGITPPLNIAMFILLLAGDVFDDLTELLIFGLFAERVVTTADPAERS